MTIPLFPKGLLGFNTGATSDIVLIEQSRGTCVSWEDIILEGLKPGNDFLTSLSKAREVAPPKIKKILIDFPISMNYTKKDIETLKRSRQGIILLLLYYFWLSICGEAFQIFPLDEQKRILEKGVEASTEASELASSINEKEIEAGYLYRAGRALYDLGKLQKAETTFRKALKEFVALAEKNPRVHDPHTASILNNLGLIYYDTGRFNQAEKAFREALKKYMILIQVNPHSYDHFTGLTLNNLGSLYSRTQFFAKSEKFHSKALKIYRRLADDNPDKYNPFLATTFNNLGTLYWNMKLYGKSEESYRESLRIRRRLAATSPDTYNPDLADTLNNVGVLYSDTKKFSESEKVFKEALAIRRNLAQENPDAHNHLVVVTLNNLGNLYSKSNRFTQAEKAFKEALILGRELAQKNPNRFDSTVAFVLRYVGLHYFRSGEMIKAEEALTKSLKQYRGLAQRTLYTYNYALARVLNELGVFYNRTRRFSQAEKAFKEALTITKECAEKTDVYDSDIAMFLTNLGTLYWDTTEFSKAEEAFNEALTLSRKLAQKNPVHNRYVAAVLNNLGNLYYDTGDDVKAEKIYTETLDMLILLRGENPDVSDADIADTLHNMGSLYRRSDQFLKAERASTEALTLMRALARKNPAEYNPKVAFILNNLGSLYHKMNNPSKAQKMYREALKITEKEKLWFSLAETYHNISTLFDNKSEEAIRIFELGILFSGEQRYRYAQKGRGESIYLRFLKYTDDPQRIFGILEALRDPDLLSLKWDVQKIQKARKNKNIQKKIVNPLFKRKDSPLSIPFQMPDTALFLYVQKMEQSILYLAVTKEGAKIFRDTLEFFDLGEQLLVNLRVQMLGGMYNKDLSDIAERFDIISTEWACTLPSEILEFLCEKDVIIFSPDATFSYFPLEGLYINGGPLCLSKKVVRATSMHQLQEIVSKNLVIGSSLIVGNPWPLINEDSFTYVHPSKIGPIKYLKDAEKEARMLAQYLPNSEILLSSRAKADTFMKELPHHSIVHFAGHGHLGRILLFSGPMNKIPPEFEAEEFSQLRKAWRSVNGKTKYMMDEWDFITDIDILETPLKKGALVFLSACETGKHKYAGGGHFQGLAQAFLKSGASNVISSLIPLYDEPSRDFALSFYRNLSHKSVSTALQDTRKIMKKKYKAHIYWLPYIHYGSPLELDSL